MATSDGPRQFRTAAAWRAWLQAHHARSRQIVLRCFKTHSRRGVGYKEALDEALCFGWIDGVRHRLDEESFSVRFTPRKARSKWSAVNVRRATALIAEGRMHPSGLAAFEGRQPTPAGYSFESREAVELPPSLIEQFQKNSGAWRWFGAQPPWYRRTSVFWVMSAKRDETRLRRFDVLLRCSSEQKRVPPLAGKPSR
jgi:uncharacterized protein YdeI (YjbR/CyaY-like superfamily)